MFEEAIKHLVRQNGGYYIPLYKIELSDRKNVERLARFLKLNIEGLTRQELNNLVYVELCQTPQKSEGQKEDYEKMWERL